MLSLLRRPSARYALACFALLLADVSAGDDWPMLGRDATHNAVSPEKNPPRHWDLGSYEPQTNAWRRDKARNIKWHADLGSNVFGDPVIASGLVWVGTNNYQRDVKSDLDASVLACFRESDGQLLYRYVSPRLPHGRVHDWPLSAMASSPLIEGDRLWLVTNRGEVLCLDIGPLIRGERQPRELWKLDMMDQLGVRPTGSRMMVCHLCSIASYQDLIYVITGNGVGETRLSVVAPDAPSLLCLRKETGDVVWKDNSPGANIMEGQWSSPLVIEAGGRAQVVAALGDGWLRSFDPLSGTLLWQFDINYKAAKLELGGRGHRNTFLATPVFYGGLVYIPSGQEPEHGEGPGRLVCLDPTKSGDISSELALDAAGKPLPIRRIQAVDEGQGERAVPNPNSGLVWEYVELDRDGDGKFGFEEQLHRTIANVTIKDGLLIAADFSGLVHCFDAKSGKLHWTSDLLASVYGAPLIVDSLVYVADEDGDVGIFRLSPEPLVACRQSPVGLQPLTEISGPNSIHCTPTFANGVLYLAYRFHLFAVKDDGSLPEGYWNQWRGPERDNLSQDSGLLQEWPADGPPLVWRTDGIGSGIASIAVAGGTIYTIGSSGEDEHVIALEEATGKMRWKTPIGGAINDAPLMRWLSQRTPTLDNDRLYVSNFDGDLVCLQTADGKELWRVNYKQDFGALRRTWGMVDYPLVDDKYVICVPGGEKATVAALDKLTGRVTWRTVLTPPEAGSHAALFAFTHSWDRLYVVVLRDSVVGISAKDGQVVWRYEASRVGEITTLTPHQADNLLLFPGGRFAPEFLVFEWREQAKTFRERNRVNVRPDHFMDSIVRLGDYIFTVEQSVLPVCANWRTGEMKWQTRAPGGGKIALTYADQRLYMLRGDGTMLLADASPAGFQLRGQFTLPDHDRAIGGTFPVITGGRMYVRDNQHLFCYDVRAASGNARPEPRMTKLDLPPPVAETTRVFGSIRRTAPRKQPAAIYVPTPPDVVAKMLETANVKATDTVFDLGSGDGRIVIAAAKTYGAKAVGIELDQMLIGESKKNVTGAGVAERVTIKAADFFSQDLSQADVVTLYLPPNVMDRLLPQLSKLKPGARVVSHFFKFSEVPPEKSLPMESKDDGDSHDIYLWTAPLIRSSSTKGQP